MKRVKNRALTALILVAAVIAGLGFYVAKYAVSGSKWAAAAFNVTAYSKGALTMGTLTDRNGVVLAGVQDGARTFAESAERRKAVLHLTGDTSGNIGTGALTVYAARLIGYNIITGAYSRTGEGKTVELSVDSDLNLEAYKALDGRHGAVMMMNYETGEILCMVSSPAYDPTNPPEIDENDPAYEGVYLNRAISSAYTPGSTFKLVTAAAAIENIHGVSEREFNCEGSLKTGEGTVSCTKAHGTLSFEEALAVSCNSAFGELALELGADTLSSYADKLGLTERISLGGILTAKGGFDKAGPDTADLAWSGIGQYNNTVCPAAMLRFVGAIANGGVAEPMRLIKKTPAAALAPSAGDRLMSRQTSEILGKMMNYNVTHSYGQDNFPGLTLHAKSGTAEVGGDKKPHSWFTGYIGNCPIAFVVIVENGGGGLAVAGAVANKVLQAALETLPDVG